jgi:hypothetical protein
VFVSIDGRDVVDSVEAGDDDGEGELVAAMSEPDGLAAPAQPAMARMIAAIAALDRFIG